MLSSQSKLSLNPSRAAYRCCAFIILLNTCSFPFVPHTSELLIFHCPFSTKVDCTIPKSPQTHSWLYLIREPRGVNCTDEVSWTHVCSGGDAGSPDGEGTELKVNTPLTTLQLSQMNTKKNHLKPELISLSERELHFSYLLTCLDGMCQRRAKDGARERQCTQTTNVISEKRQVVLVKQHRFPLWAL